VYCQGHLNGDFALVKGTTCMHLLKPSVFLPVPFSFLGGLLLLGKER
jgi:hypothetical protein